MATARDIIYRALEDVGVTGVGQTPLAEDMNFGLTRLNAMIGQFNRRRWLVYRTADVSCISTGQPVYTLGENQQFNIPIVDKLSEGCFFRQYQTGGGIGESDFDYEFNTDFVNLPTTSPPPLFIDYPLTIIWSREDWNEIALKNLTSWPAFIFYDYANAQLQPRNVPLPYKGPLYPAGFVHITPIPQPGQFEIHLNVKQPLVTLTDLSTVLLTPPEYEEAFEYNLAIRFAAKYQIDASKEVLGLAAASLATIRSANNTVPLMELPSGLSNRGFRYNIYSDRAG